MKTIGLIGGMSAESTQIYYRLVNEEVRRRLGGLHSAECIISSLDFAPIVELQRRGGWDEAGAILARHARRLEQAGADVLLIGTNTMHKVADAVAGAVSIPLLHIADPTGAAIGARGLSRVALLATAFTMEQTFYRERLSRLFGLEVMTPEADERRAVHDIIYDELCQGRIESASRAAYLRIIARLVEAGAEGVIFGCTEIGLLLKAEDLSVPVFDTCALHAAAAVDFALGD